MTPPSSIQRIKELLAKATPGEWKSARDSDVNVYAMGFRIATMKGGEITRDSKNAELICLLRNTIESLLDERERHVEVLSRISYAKPDRLDHSIDVGIIERVAKIAKKALEEHGSK